MEKNETKIKLVLTPEFEFGDYANVVNVSNTGVEVVLTFAQVVIPFGGEQTPDEVPAKPVARVVLPPVVAERLHGLLSELLSKK